jgi:phosphate-selective porin OprO/OprP
MPSRPLEPPAAHALARFSLALLALLFAHAEAATASPGDAPARDGEAGDTSATDSGSAPWTFDRVWGLGTLYENPDNPVIEKLALRGRFQLDFPLFESNRGTYNDPQIRRLRLGFKSDWLADLVLHVEVDMDFICDEGDDCTDDAYEGLTDAYVGWSPSEAFELKLGKLSAPFTLDGETSSTRLITLERNNVSNNIWFPVEYHAGGKVSGRRSGWRYLAGAFSSSTTENFGDLEGGFFLLFTLGHDFSERLGVPECTLTANFVYNDPNPRNVSTRPLQHVMSLHGRYDTGR